jgi:hypothetical protein
MDLDRDRSINWLTTVALPGTGIIRLMDVECCKGTEGVDSPIRGFAGFVVLAGRRGCHRHDGDAVLVKSRGSGAHAQEGPPLVFPVGVLSVCM